MRLTSFPEYLVIDHNISVDAVSNALVQSLKNCPSMIDVAFENKMLSKDKFLKVIVFQGVNKVSFEDAAKSCGCWDEAIRTAFEVKKTESLGKFLSYLVDGGEIDIKDLPKIIDSYEFQDENEVSSEIQQEPTAAAISSVEVSSEIQQDQVTARSIDGIGGTGSEKINPEENIATDEEQNSKLEEVDEESVTDNGGSVQVGGDPSIEDSEIKKFEEDLEVRSEKFEADEFQFPIQHEVINRNILDGYLDLYSDEEFGKYNQILDKWKVSPIDQKELKFLENGCKSNIAAAKFVRALLCEQIWKDLLDILTLVKDQRNIDPDKAEWFRLGLSLLKELNRTLDQHGAESLWQTSENVAKWKFFYSSFEKFSTLK